MSESEATVVYLLHFDQPLAHAKHYLGYTNNLERRIKEHRRGHSGSHIMRVLKQRGIGFVVARTWEGGTRADERRMKGRGKGRMCPICKAEKSRERSPPPVREQSAGQQDQFADIPF